MGRHSHELQPGSFGLVLQPVRERSPALLSYFVRQPTVAHQVGDAQILDREPVVTVGQIGDLAEVLITASLSLAGVFPGE